MWKNKGGMIMSEDNNGNRNSIKPVRNNIALKNVKKQVTEREKQKIKDEKENTISEAHSSIDSFGIKKQKKIVRQNNEKSDSINYFKH